MSWKIRQETPADYDEVYELVKTSFATSSHADGTEPDYLSEVRQKDTFIPELSLVTEDETGRIIGQIVLYQTGIITENGVLTELVLSPICVHSDYFRRGIAREMVETALGKARQMEYRAVFLCGNPAFYPKLGFSATYRYGIFHVNDPEHTGEWSMVRELYPGALTGITGSIDTL